LHELILNISRRHFLLFDEAVKEAFPSSIWDRLLRKHKKNALREKYDKYIMFFFRAVHDILEGKGIEDIRSMLKRELHDKSVITLADALAKRLKTTYLQEKRLWITDLASSAWLLTEEDKPEEESEKRSEQELPVIRIALRERYLKLLKYAADEGETLRKDNRQSRDVIEAVGKGLREVMGRAFEKIRHVPFQIECVPEVIFIWDYDEKLIKPVRDFSRSIVFSAEELMARIAEFSQRDAFPTARIMGPYLLVTDSTGSVEDTFRTLTGDESIDLFLPPSIPSLSIELEEEILPSPSAKIWEILEPKRTQLIELTSRPVYDLLLRSLIQFMLPTLSSAYPCSFRRGEYGSKYIV